jgi:hypothetical protein
MQKGRMVWALCLWVLSCSPGWAQADFDVTGRWVLETPSAPGAVDALFVRADGIFIDIERTRAAGTTFESHSRGSRGSVSPEMSTYEHAGWVFHELVFERGHHTGRTPGTGDNWSSRLEVWTLDEQGRLHIRISAKGSAEPNVALDLAYRRP